MFLSFLALASCIPAATPPILEATPGSPVIVTDDQVITADFAVRYPSEWRVITSEAAAPPTITLVAPGDCAIIIVSSVVVDAPSLSPDCGEAVTQPDARTVYLRDEKPITIVGVARDSEYRIYLDVFERVVTSVEDPSLRVTPDGVELTPREGTG